MWLADTTFLIDLVKVIREHLNDPGASEKAINIDQSGLPVYISVITVTEYLRGIFYLFRDSDELEKRLLKAETDLNTVSNHPN